MAEIAKPILTKDRILEFLIKVYWVKDLSEDTFSVICSYTYQLEMIADSYNVELIEWANSAGGLTVSGTFKVIN